MKKLLFLVTLLCATSATAAVVTQQQAMQIAQNFLSENNSTSSTAPNPNTSRTLGNISVGGVSLGRVTTPQLALSHKALSKTGTVDFYVFNKADKSGFVVVSGDDRFAPVLGYGDNGAFDVNNIPDGMQYLLGEYQREMEFLKANPKAVAYRGLPLGRNLKPLIQTKWDQGYPYNNMCPLVEGQRRYTGCVATATAQILKYHKWPEGKYKWNLMDDTYSIYSEASHCDAVAVLMRDLGIAAHMKYGKNGSSAYSEDMKDALVGKFMCDKKIKIINHDGYWYDSDCYTDEEWDQVLVDELDEGRPVYFAGCNNSRTLAHAFVIDGYDYQGRFHVNWGWSGKYDSYFYTSVMEPGDMDFSFLQDMIIGIRPPQIMPAVEWKAASVMPANNVQAEITLKNDKDKYDGRLCMVIYLLSGRTKELGYLGKELYSGRLDTKLTPKICATINSDLISLKPFETKHITITGSISEPVGTNCHVIVCREDQLPNVMGFISAAPYSCTGNAKYDFESKPFVVGEPIQKSQGKVADEVWDLGNLNLLIGCMLNRNASADTSPACDINGDGIVDNADITELIQTILEQR